MELWSPNPVLFPTIVPTPLEAGHCPRTGIAKIAFAGADSLGFAAFLRK